jgi:hypothetical protein
MGQLFSNGGGRAVQFIENVSGVQAISQKWSIAPAATNIDQCTRKPVMAP